MSGAAVVPEAEVSVYEVPETMKEALTGEELTEEQLQALMTQENLVVSGVWTNKSGSGYTFADGSVNPAWERSYPEGPIWWWKPPSELPAAVPTIPS